MILCLMTGRLRDEFVCMFKKAFGRARRGKDISSFERQEKESGFNFLHNHNNGRMRSGHIVINGIGMFKQIMKSGT